MNGNPRFDASQDIPDVRYSHFAELIGLKGIFVDDPKDLGDAWDEALSADRPVVLEVKTDPEIAPLPPHISLKQAKQLHVLHGQRRGRRSRHPRHGASGHERSPRPDRRGLVSGRLPPVAESAPPREQSTLYRSPPSSAERS